MLQSLFFGFCLLGVASAQSVNGVSMVVFPSDSGSGGSSSVMGDSSPVVMSTSYGSMPSYTPSPSYPAASSMYSPPPASSSDMYNSMPSYTPSPSYSAAPSMYTPPPVSSSDMYSSMPYSSFMDGGYSSMNCGYGYYKSSDGSCKPESWVRLLALHFVGMCLI
jgi:hypothetical protein